MTSNRTRGARRKPAVIVVPPMRITLIRLCRMMIDEHNLGQREAQALTLAHIRNVVETNVLTREYMTGIFCTALGVADNYGRDSIGRQIAGIFVDEVFRIRG